MKTSHVARLFGVAALSLGLVHCASRSTPVGRSAPESTSADYSEDDEGGAPSRDLNFQLSVPAVPPTPGDAFSDVPVVATEKAVPDMYFKNWGTNPTFDTRAAPLSTFSVDVDTASYAMARAFLGRGDLPPYAAVRVEEMINAFDYKYEAPTEATFTLVGEAVPSPSRPGYHFLHLGLKAREVSRAQREPAGLVFVIDVSGSMAQDNRLGMVKRALAMLVGQLDERDTVAVVVYGSTARVMLPPTRANERARIMAAIDDLAPEGSTNVQAGLSLAYTMAGGRGRIILCSDGVANSGLTEADGIIESIREGGRRGVTLTTVGFGMGNYNDALMERLAQIGSGNYAYVDREAEAHRIFVEQLTGTLQVVAEDAKIQVELDPRYVLRYRLVGYENRVMQAADFRNDKKDAGEVGAGHAVTAIYEVKLARDIPAGARLGVVRVRHKAVGATAATELERPIPAAVMRASLSAASPAIQLSLAVAGFGEKLRGSYWARGVSYAQLSGIVSGLPAAWRDRPEVRELAGLIGRAGQLDARKDRFESYPLAAMAYDEVPVVEDR